MITILLSLLALVASLFILGLFLFFVIALTKEAKHDKKTNKP